VLDLSKDVQLNTRVVSADFILRTGKREGASERGSERGERERLIKISR
jgi:hypothetical protein